MDDPGAYAYGDEPAPVEAEAPRARARIDPRVAGGERAGRPVVARASPLEPEPEPREEPVPEPPRMMNSLQREAAERKAAKDIALAAGRGGLAQEAFAQAGNATDPFIAHQLAKLGVNEEKYKEAMDAAAAERSRGARGGEGTRPREPDGGRARRVRWRVVVQAAQKRRLLRRGLRRVLPAGAGGGRGGPAPLEKEPASQRKSPAPSPFEVSDDDDRKHYRTASMEQSAALRNATYEAPKFGRQRAQDLMITGPSMRGSGARPDAQRGGSLPRRRQLRYAQSTCGSECTTTVAATSYYNA